MRGLGESGEEGSADKLTATTPGGEFSIRTVACFRQCALAPAVEIEQRILGPGNGRRLEREVEAVRRGGRS